MGALAILESCGAVFCGSALTEPLPQRHPATPPRPVVVEVHWGGLHPSADLRRELLDGLEATGHLVTWDIVANVLLGTDTLGAAIWDIELTPDGTELWVSFPGTQHGTIKAYARADRSFLRSMLVEGSPRRIAFDVAGTVAIVANDASSVNVIR